MKFVEREGEASLKCVEIVEWADVTGRVITHYFGTREGPLTLPHAQHFGGMPKPDLDGARRLVSSTHDRGQQAVGTHDLALTDVVVYPIRSSIRFARRPMCGACLW